MPLRKSIRDLASMSPERRAEARAAARLHLGLSADRRTLLVFGGSLGARHINATMAQVSDDLAAADIQVVHIVGSAGQGLPDDWPPKRSADQPAYVSLPYLAAMHEAFAAADAVVCRAGAMTCAEVSAVGLPAVYVPLPVGNGEQRLNARPVVDAGGGVLVDDADFEPEAVRGLVIPLVTDVERCERMSAKAREFAIVDADERLADIARAAAALHGETKLRRKAKRDAKVSAP
jgi:UDP-N-acetylglucosamine--N-acetylmuramyl-(pentapeptide) pyrophosphoryl-undecaprenol N-acetylglucosamine transferase